MIKVRPQATLVVITATALALFGASIAHGESEPQYRVSLPAIQLKKEPIEQIEKLEVFVRCGTIAAVNAIPYDWAVTVDSPVSLDTTMRMEAGHGATSVQSSTAFKNFITVTQSLAECFDITVTVHIFWEDELRTVEIKKRDLVLTKLPNQAL